MFSFTTLISVMAILAAAVGIANVLQSRKRAKSAPVDTPAHEVLAIELEHLRSRNEKPVVVMFFATFCPGCAAQTPIFKRVARELDSLAHFVFIDVDKNESLRNRMEVRKIPVIMVFKGTEPYVAKHIGVQNDEELTAFVKAAI